MDIGGEEYVLFVVSLKPQFLKNRASVIPFIFAGDHFCIARRAARVGFGNHVVQALCAKDFLETNDIRV